ncbi:MAG TPA: ribosomal protein S18-alanine N-acetyltransferase [Nitrospiraceae bacterium]|nr:ribosomal protein S18-alanine N-acetyltransferase [Nitrospiraceae bacterium]
MKGSFTIEPATLEALSDILHIEEACFSAPWTRKMLEAELTGNRFAHFLLAKQSDMPGTDSTAVVGYLCYWIVFEEVRLMNLAVLSSVRRQGLARTLVIHALQTGVNQGAVRAVLEVRASNIAAQTLYQRLGFHRIATRPSYYTNPSEDAVLMELEPIVVQPQWLQTSGSQADSRVRHA